MTLLDTSILIGVYRKRASAIGQRIAQLIVKKEACICGPVWVEYLSGFRSAARREEHAIDLSVLPWLETTRAAYTLAAELRATHAAIGSMDAIIAATAIVNRATLLTADGGFVSLRSRGVQVVSLS